MMGVHSRRNLNVYMAQESSHRAMFNVTVLYWVALDVILVALMLLIAVSAVPHRSITRRMAPPQRRSARGQLRATYAAGFELGLALPLLATFAQTLRLLGALPQRLPAETTRWVVLLTLAAVVGSASCLTLGLVADWRASRQLDARYSESDLDG